MSNAAHESSWANLPIGARCYKVLPGSIQCQGSHWALPQ